MTFCANSLSFGQARARYGPVLALSRKQRRRLLALFVLIRRRALDILHKAHRCVADWFATGGSGYAQLDALRWPSKPAIDTSPLVRAAEKKQSVQEAQLVVEYVTPAIQPAHGPVLAAAPITRQWAGASTTPGLPNVVSTKDSAERLAAAKVNHPEWLIGPSKRWQRS